MSPGYDFYFGRSRPEFVTRWIAAKQRNQLDLCLRARPDIRTVLEIGPGEGWFAEACRTAELGYRAIEASEVGAGRLRDRGFTVEVATVPPLPSGAPVDLVYMSHVVEHLSAPSEVVALVEAAGALLREGGIVVLAYPDAQAMGGDFWDCDYTHRWPSTPRRMAQVASDAGFRKVAQHRRCLQHGGLRGAALRGVTRLLPFRTLARIVPSRADWLLRGKALFSPDVVTIIEPMTGRDHTQEQAA